MTPMYIMCFCQNGFVLCACIGRIAVTLDTIVHHSGCRKSGADDGWLVGWSGWLGPYSHIHCWFCTGCLKR